MTNTSPNRGRPSRLNPQTINRIAKAVQSGKTRAETAAQIGVPLTTLQGWITIGRRVRANGGNATGNLEQMALRLVVALEVAERKRRAIVAILSDDELSKTVPEGRKPIGRPALFTAEILEAVTPLCVEGRMREAADAAGVDKRSVLRWLSRGREVHANGGAKTEYERLCGLLHARLEAARPSIVPESSPAAEPAARLASGGIVTGLPVIGESTEPAIVIGGRKPGRTLLQRLISTRFGLRPVRGIPYRA